VRKRRQETASEGSAADQPRASAAALPMKTRQIASLRIQPDDGIHAALKCSGNRVSSRTKKHPSPGGHIITPTTSMKKALFVAGGWEGHQPEKIAGIFQKELEDRGFAVEVAHSLDMFADADLLKSLVI
jgi:hypothetical protein